MAKITVTVTGASEADMVRAEHAIMLSIPAMMPDSAVVTVESAE
jgi:hypothetical protein